MTQLWTPTQQTVQQAIVADFIRLANQRFNLSLNDFHDLYQWSVNFDTDFWSLLWDFFSIKGDKGEQLIADSEYFYQRRFFPAAQLNFAEHFLQNRSDDVAITFWGEAQIKQKLSYAQLYYQVSKFIQFLDNEGIKSGDRVVGVMPNMPQTIVAMLAVTAIGAIWASASPDFGEQGLLERFSQINPKLLLVSDGYFYKGKKINCLDKYQSVIKRIPSIKSAVVVNYIDQGILDATSAEVFLFEEILETYPEKKIQFKRFAFNHPVYILFSSGTTGVPKCIVHCAGGVLLQHIKELTLHANIKPKEKLFYFTTCGWMMWNWLVSGLTVGAKLMLYDGNPFELSNQILLDYIEKENINHFGTSAKYIDSLNKFDLNPSETHDLSSLKTIFSTGSPLSVSSYDFVYQNISADVCLSSISGGTDIISCFALGAAVLPVYRGQLQTRGLGMAVSVLDDEDKAVFDQQGELACTKPFPCMPLGFWKDEGNKKYTSTYFYRQKNIWHHGDFVALTPEKGMIFYGRSDSTLNPGGVRIGTAEIYRQLDKIPEIFDSVVIGQNYEDDVRVVLFVQLHEQYCLDDSLISRIKQTIRRNTTPRHVPSVVLSVKDIPKTKSGKTVELAVRDIVHGERVKNLSSLTNPEALEFFTNRNELL